ncbi:MAG: hypothetical protein ACYTEZ_08365 [Planctomycetota bacterium]|jgi:hypothetical protein
MLWRVLGTAVLCAVVAAQDPDDLGERIEKLERDLQRERARGDAREKRIAELERALQKATDALARAQDRRTLEDEIDAYLRARAPVGPEPGPASRLNIGAVIVTSYRYTDLSNGGKANTFLLDEVYLRFVYRFAERVTARYYTNGSLAELEYHHHDLLQLNVGRIVVPFGQFNPRSFPDTFDTLSRPLLYLGDADIFQTPENSPSAVFRTIYSDTGIVASGNWWREGNQLYYAVFVTNGLVGTTDLGSGASFRDNNDNKQLGARVTYTLASWWERARLGFGLSWMTGKYDDANRLSYRMYGADVVLVIDRLFRGGEGSITVRGEYVYAPREILVPTVGDPTLFLNSENRTQGAYLLVETRIDARWMVYIEGDWLAQKAPLLSGGAVDPANAALVHSRVRRISVGLVYKFSLGIVWKVEYAYWGFNRGAPNANRIGTQLVIPF